MFDIEKARAKGMSEDVIKIMERVNENAVKRESCTGHDFEMESYSKYICKNCGCEQDHSYVSGYRDATVHIAARQ